MPGTSSIDLSPTIDPEVHGALPDAPDALYSSEGEARCISPSALLLAGAPCGLPPGLAALPTLGTLVQALRNAWLLGLGAALLGAGLTTLVLLRLLPHSYAATVWLRLEGPIPAVAGDDQEEALHIPNGGAGAAPPLLFKSPPLMIRVLDLPQVRDLPELARLPQSRAWLEDNLQVEKIDHSGLVRLMLTTQAPETGAVVLDKIVDAYQEQLREQRQALLAQLRDQYQRLANGERRVPRGDWHETKVVPRQPAPATRAAARPSPDQAALDQTRLELKRLRGDLTVLEVTVAQPIVVPADQVEAHLAKDSQIKIDQAQCKRIELLLTQIKQVARDGENSTSYQEKARELEAVQARIRQRKQEIAGQLETELEARAKEKHRAKIAPCASASKRCRSRKKH